MKGPSSPRSNEKLPFTGGVVGKPRRTSKKVESPSISTEKWVSVTPALASEWLENRHRNRGISDGMVRSYFQEMADGRWSPELPTTQPIVLDHQGRLVNGQHRLSAILIFGRPVAMRVATLKPGVVLESLRTAEVLVRPQTAADLISALDGKSNATTRASFAKMWLALERDIRINERVPVPLQLKAIRQNAALFDSVVEMCRGARVRTLCNAPFGGLWLWASTGKHGLPDEFRNFAAAYISGTNLKNDDPAHLLREHVLGCSFRSHDRAATVKRVANAFEAHLQAKALNRVSIGVDGLEALAERIGKTAPQWVLNGKRG